MSKENNWTDLKQLPDAVTDVNGNRWIYNYDDFMDCDFDDDGDLYILDNVKARDAKSVEIYHGPCQPLFLLPVKPEEVIKLLEDALDFEHDGVPLDLLKFYDAIEKIEKYLETIKSKNEG